MKNYHYLKIVTLIMILSTLKSFSAWEIQTPLMQNDFLAIFFIDSTTGWISGGAGKIFKTSDAGENWMLQTTNSTNAINDLFFINSNIGWAIEYDSGILKTTNGGSYWEKISNTYAKENSAVYFIDSLIGFVSGYQIIKSDWISIISKTTDGGVNWTYQKFYGPPSSGGRFDDIWFIDSQNGIAIGPNKLIRTNDSGKTWKESSFFDRFCYSINFLNSSNGWLTGCTAEQGHSLDLVLYTSDGGNNWIDKSDSLQISPKDIFFVDTLNGWVLGNKGVIIRTSDNGLNWSIDSTGTTQELNKLFFVSPQKGWAVGRNGAILKYTSDKTDNIENQDFTKKESSINIIPNPANNKFKIIIDLKKSGKVELSLYSIDGKMIDKILNKEFDAGQHQIDYDTQKLASGEYLLTLKIQNEIISEKIVVR